MDYWKTTYSYVGYIDYKSVTTATTVAHGDKCGIAFVAIDSDYRHREYASTSRVFDAESTRSH
jgi:hypothetical protein